MDTLTMMIERDELEISARARLMAVRRATLRDELESLPDDELTTIASRGGGETLRRLACDVLRERITCAEVVG